LLRLPQGLDYCRPATSEQLFVQPWIAVQDGVQSALALLDGQVQSGRSLRRITQFEVKSLLKSAAFSLNACIDLSLSQQIGEI